MVEFNTLAVTVVAPDADAGTLSVMLVFVVIAVMVVGYLKVPLPSVVNAIAEPPTVRANWKVFAAVEIT